MYEYVVAAGERSLSAQREELSGMRTRAVAFAALTITGSAFLVGSGLSIPIGSRDALFYVLAIGGTVMFGAMAVALVLVAVPGKPFKFVLLPDELAKWIDGEQPVPSRTIMMRKLATKTMPDMMQVNESSLKWTRGWYITLLIVGVLSVASWTAIAWVYA